MNRRILALVVFVAVCCTSCNFFWDKMASLVEKTSEQQDAVADSLKRVIIAQKDIYTGSPSFTAKMDTVYASGFRLAELLDSTRHSTNKEEWQVQYNTELKFFRNYVSRHFYFDESINTGLSTIGIADTYKRARKSDVNNNLPKGMEGMMTIMVKPTIMEIIIACRKQYNLTDTAFVSSAFASRP